MNTLPAINFTSGDPRTRLEEWLPSARRESEALLCVEFQLPQYWLEGAPNLQLCALYLWQDENLQVAVMQGRPVEPASTAGTCFNALVQAHGLFVVRSGDALPLAVHAVDKPWGRELWYTGVEQRGVCQFGDFSGVPQPWLLAVLPGMESVGGEPLVLLKVLDPAPEPVTGDLYFELHDVKQELYVVTHVDRDAWPEGIGRLRYGFDPERIAEHDDEAAFRSAYLAAVLAYREVREQIDALPDGQVADSKLQQRERELRESMDRFTFLKPVVQGDVILVPRLLPHALQHGVRVVEFQTPVYERRILSFAQRVLTQPHWDTRDAVRDMLLLPSEGPGQPLESLGRGCQREKLAQFPGFEVWRYTLQPGSELDLQIPEGYALLMMIEGEMVLDDRDYGTGQAALLPAGWRGILSLPQGAPPLVFLLAQPSA